MSDQPEALFLADELEAPLGTVISYQVDCRAAVELRRLHAENERLHQINEAHEMKLSVRGYELQIADLQSRDASLRTERDALKADAERYRWLRDHCYKQKWPNDEYDHAMHLSFTVSGIWWNNRDPAVLDGCIDDARSKA